MITFAENIVVVALALVLTTGCASYKKPLADVVTPDSANYGISVDNHGNNFTHYVGVGFSLK